MAIVYKHIRLDTNEVFYIGIGKDEKRAYQTDNRRNKYWKNIINHTKYKVEITHKDICYEEAQAIEKYLISFYGRSNKNEGTLCNLTDGGEGCLGIIVSEETREKFRGKNNYMFGKTHSLEVREKMKKIIKEKMKNEKIRKIISDKAKGRLPSAKTKEKLCISSPIRKELYQIIDNKLIIYNSIRDAAKKLHISRKNLKLRPHNYPFIPFDKIPLELLKNHNL